MKSDVLFRSIDVDVITQAIEELRTVGLRIDRVHSNMLSKNAALRTLSFGIDIDALVGLPNTGESPERSKVSQIVWSNVGRFGEDVVRNGEHRRCPVRDFRTFVWTFGL